jgi:FKBP-type peptidyl-prolyl cis-trans isomerase 2
VKSIDEDTLVVDFNHPLAGREIRFNAHILAVLPHGVQVMEIR